MILFVVQRDEEDNSTHVIVNAYNREFAKAKAHRFLGDDPSKYIVTPLTNKGDKVYFDLTIKN